MRQYSPLINSYSINLLLPFMNKPQKRFNNQLFFYLLVIQMLGISSAFAFKSVPYTISSPDKKLSVQFQLTEDKKAVYSVKAGGKPVLAFSKLGVVMEDQDFSKGLSFVSASKVEFVKDQYELYTGKKKNVTYQANKQVFHLKNASGKLVDIIFQVSDDGFAFRYYFPGKATDRKKIKEEISSFHFLPDSKGWLQPMSDAKTGWEKCHPSYEEYYQKGIATGTPSPIKAGWVYPALFNSGDTWILISETGLDSNYCATRLRAQSPDREYSIGFPQPQEIFNGGALNPESSFPWYSPWRVVAVGSLKTVSESTLGTDLAAPAIKMDKSFIKPGISSWSWVLMKDDSTVYSVQKRFIDYAADMNWEYCLVDADWDTKIGYDKMKELADYAKTKNVGVIVWYNSAGDWNTTPYHPRNKLLTRADRLKEFARLKEMGIKGVKVDFFGGDGQSVVKYYLDILEDAAKTQILVNCHGSTLPRGWQRTYPHLVSMEAIKGFEFATFKQENLDVQPVHCTTIPFTRNVFDPMDYTPMCLYKVPGLQRRTTSAFELALPVIFLSGVQHIAETPEGMSHVPDYVKTFLRGLPGSWDDSRFIDGYPGKLAVFARKSGNIWYIAGINGENTEKKLQLDLSFLDNKSGTLITDGAEPLSFTSQSVKVTPGQKLDVTVKGNGGFVIKVK